MLNIVLPKGSLERATLELFDDADLGVTRSSDVDYRATIDDPRVDRGADPAAPGDPALRRRGSIRPRHHRPRLDRGDRGRRRRRSPSCTTRRRRRARSGWCSRSPPTRRLQSRRRPPGAGLRVHTEYPELTKRYFAQHGIDADVTLSYGATEAKVPDIADAVVEITETGRALRAAGLRIIDTILTSYTELIASPAAYADPEKRVAMEQLMVLLTGVARGPRSGAHQAQRRRREPRRRDRAAAGVEVADRVEAVQRGRVSRSRPSSRSARSTS